MKRINKTSFVLLACIALLSSYISKAPAYAESDMGSAYNIILVYNQNGTWAYDSDKYVYSLYYGTNVSLNKSGCHIYTYAHAIQWLTSEPRNSSNGGALLSELIGVLNGESPESGDAEAIFKNYVINSGIGESVSTSFTESTLESLFDEGGLVISNPYGHYNLAVGMTHADFDNNGSREAYVHIVDSSCQSTWWRLNSGNSYSSTSYSAYDYSSHGAITGYCRYKNSVGDNEYVNGTIGGVTKSNWGGGEYWVSYNTYMSAFQRRAAFLPTTNSVISFDTYKTEVITENDIKVSAWLNNPDGYLLSSIGIQCGSDKNTAPEREITGNVGWTRANLSYSASAFFGELASNRTYYIRYFAVADGVKYYSKWIEATTVKGEISFDTYSVDNLYESDVRLSVWLDNPNAKHLAEIGIIYGKSRELTASKIITSNIGWTRSNQSYYLSAFYGHYLESGTQYHARYYVLSDGKTYYSDWFDLVTPAGGISFDTYCIDGISDKDATPSVWLDNPSARALSQIGLENYIAEDSVSRALIAENVTWTRSHLNKKMSSLIGNLKPDSTYHVRFFVVSDEKTYCSDWLLFKTEASTAHDPMQSPDFTLPVSLKVIPDEAFAGASMTVVKCPEGLEEIGEDAFKGCAGLREIYIPDSVTSIGGGAFDGCAADLVIFGHADSVAQAHAKLNGIGFVAVD